MTHPLYASRAGRVLYRELPQIMRQYDNRDPETGRLGDLEAFLFGCGHLLDRFDATLVQFHADGFLDPAGPPGNETGIQGWLLPYVAQLFGVELVAPDTDSRRAELAESVWIARRRGTLIAVDRAAEMVTGLPAVAVPGAARALRAADMRRPLMTQREISGRWHPADAAILHEALPGPAAPATHVTGFAATRPAAHEGLPCGLTDPRRAMRAVLSGIERADAELRPATGSGAPGDLVPFVIHHRRGRPCFPDSYEDRSPRTPDMRAPALRRRPAVGQARPDAVMLFLRPPTGIFTGTEPRLPAPSVVRGRLDDVDLPPGLGRADVYHDTNTTLALTAANADAAGMHVIRGMKFHGTLQVHPGIELRLQDCAIRRLTGPTSAVAADSPPVLIRARGCIFDLIDLANLRQSGATIEMEYCTVMASATLHLTRASEVLFNGALVVDGDGAGGVDGCLRYSIVPPGFDRSHVDLYRSERRVPLFLRWPCIQRGGVMVHDAVPAFGEPGYGVLSDSNPPAISQAAEDGGEIGIYHDRWHLARVGAALRKAGAALPAGQHVHARYDTRLLAPLPGAGDA